MRRTIPVAFIFQNPPIAHFKKRLSLFSAMNSLWSYYVEKKEKIFFFTTACAKNAPLISL